MSSFDRDADIIDIERLVYATGLREHAEAWQRIRARLTPDRERVTSALKRAYMPRFAPEELDLSRWDSWEKLADAAIAAMGETP